jgi:outer membrane protein OmpA-like peptidoglycan-associated protein
VRKNLSKIAVFSALVTLFCALNPVQIHAQVSRGAQRAYENALQSYASFDLDNTIVQLEKALKKSPDFHKAWFLLAQTNRDLNRDSLAIIALNKGLSINDRSFQRGWLELAELNWTLGNYKAGVASMDHFKNTDVFRKINTDSLLYQHYRWVNNGLEFSIKAVSSPLTDIDIRPLEGDVNSEMQEYYPTMTLDGNHLVFTRIVPSSFGNFEHEDFYFTSRNASDTWSFALPLEGINTAFNEGAPSISGDGMTIIFTACASPRDGFGDRQGKGSCDLFESVYNPNTQTWSLGENLGAPNSGAWESQPTLSADGNFLVFARARHSRNRGSDLFGAMRGEDGTWGKPFILPGKINTPFEEESPFLHPDGKTLYFSSNGHAGLGGLDIFVSRKSGEGLWGAPVNLGYPLNTNRNENSLLVEPGGEKAIFATNRSTLNGDLDLWQFTLPQDSRPTSVGVLSGIVLDQISLQPIEANVDLVNVKTGEFVASVTSKAVSGDANGFILPLPENGRYSFEVSREGYMFKIDDVFSIDSADRDRHIEVILEKIKTGASISMKTVRFESGSADLADGYQTDLSRLVIWLRSNPTSNVQIIGHTDNIGAKSSNKVLSTSRALSVMNFLVSNSIDPDRLSYSGVGSLDPIETNDTAEGRSLNRRVEIVVK